MAKCETMRVRVEGQKDPIVINVADFDSAPCTNECVKNE